MGWSLPEQGWITLNIDGGYKEVSMAGRGGLLRDHDGRWITGFSFKLGACTALAVELWAILQCLIFVWAKGLIKLTVETDSLVALRGIKNRRHANNKHNTILKECLDLLIKPGLDSENEACLHVVNPLAKKGEM